MGTGTPLPVSAREVHRVVPQGYDPADDAAPCYFLRTPTVYDRARIERAVTSLGARNITFPDVLAGLRAAATTMLDDPAAAIALVDEYEQLLGDIAKHQQQAVATTAAAAGDAIVPSTPETETPPPAVAEDPLVTRLRDVTPEIDRLEVSMVAQVPAYAELLAARDYWWTIYRTETARHLLKGWVNIAMPFTKDPLGVLSIAVLSALEPVHVFEISLAAVGLLNMSPAQRGN